MNETILKRIEALYSEGRIADEQLAAYVAAGIITQEKAAEIGGTSE